MATPDISVEVAKENNRYFFCIHIKNGGGIRDIHLVVGRKKGDKSAPLGSSSSFTGDSQSSNYTNPRKPAGMSDWRGTNGSQVDQGLPDQPDPGGTGDTLTTVSFGDAGNGTTGLSNNELSFQIEYTGGADIQHFKDWFKNPKCVIATTNGCKKVKDPKQCFAFDPKTDVLKDVHYHAWPKPDIFKSSGPMSGTFQSVAPALELKPGPPAAQSRKAPSRQARRPQG